MKHLLSIILTSVLCIMQGQAMENLTVGGTKREMIVYAPKGLPQQAPLVIACHGMNQSASYLQGDSHWEEVADTAKFVVVYPNGIGNADGSNRGWDISGDRDINFVLAIINEMYDRYGINRNRVYLTGFSMGGMFTYHCANRIADKIAAFAPVSGYRMGGPNATASRPVPLFHTHGTGDDVCTYGSVDSHIKAWAKFNGCDATPVTYSPYPVGTYSPAKLEVYKHGKNGVEVALLTLKDKGHWWSRDESQAHTTREVWNFCKRWSLGDAEPTVQKIAPEVNSFDMDPLKDTTFTLQFIDTIVATNAVATLSHDDTQIDLIVSNPSAKQLVLTLPKNIEIPNGTYTLKVSGATSKGGIKMREQNFTYAYGIEEVGPELKVDTLYVSNLSREQETILEGIPSGWKRQMTNDAGTEILTGPLTSIAGVRMKYFQPGGDFDAGFYFSARDYSRTRLTYGQVNDYRLELEKGNYTVSFKSVYWSDGAKAANATFNFEVRNTLGEIILSEGSLRSTTSMSENTNQKLTGSVKHTFDFSVEKKTFNLLFFEMTEGWNSVIFGDIILTTQPTLADRYKGTYVRLMLAAKEAISKYEGKAVEDLKAVIDQYEGFTSTSPSAYNAVIEALNSALAKFNASSQKTSTSLSVLNTSADIESSIFYNLLGQRVDNPSRGVFIQNGKKVILK